MNQPTFPTGSGWFEPYEDGPEEWCVKYSQKSNWATVIICTAWSGGDRTVTVNSSGTPDLSWSYVRALKKAADWLFRLGKFAEEAEAEAGIDNTGRNEYDPDTVSPPGETLAETLKAKGMSAATLADRMGYPDADIDGVLRGTVLITPEMAQAMERGLGVPAHFWIKREQAYRRRKRMPIPVEIWIGIIDRLLAMAFEYAALIARLQAGDQVTDAEARPRPRAEVEAGIREMRERMIAATEGQT